MYARRRDSRTINRLMADPAAPAPPGVPADPAPIRVRDAMLAEPRTLPATATAQEAGGILSRQEVRSVLVVDDAGRLVGNVTRELLVDRVVATGALPGAVRLGDIAAPVALAIDAAMDAEEAFRVMEEHDAERLPVLDGGRLVGVLSRSVLQRRLAEDEPPADSE